jgi:threonine synthase
VIPLVERYRDRLPLEPDDRIVTLYEGSTPLVHADALSKELGADIWLKLESMNPTGSFKDRGMTMAVTKAVEEGARAIMCASTGNTSAAAAAYAAQAGLDCVVILPNSNVALGKLSQALIHGAKVLAVEGSFDDALRLVRECTANYPLALVNSVNPYRIEGQKTASFEVIDALGDSPDYHALPVGNAGNITAYWKGYKEYHAAGKATKLPKMLGFQAAGAAPLVDGAPVEKPQTIATAIRIGNPASWDGAIAARDESGGLIDKVTDEEILEAYAMAATLEGVFAEPASTAPIAGLRKLAAKGFFDAAPVSVAVTLTGHGLKDPDRAIKSAPGMIQIPASLDAVVKALNL